MSPRASTSKNAVRPRFVIVTLTPALPPGVRELLSQFRSRPEVDCVHVLRIEDLPSAVAAARRVVILATFMEPSDIPPVVQFLRRESGRLDRGDLKVMAVSRIRHPQVSQLLVEAGVSEIVDFAVPMKTLLTKVSLALRLTDFPKLLKTSKAAPGELRWTEAEEHPADQWILTNRQRVRFVMGKWLIDLLGPSSLAGSWQSTDLQWKGEMGWEWKPRAVYAQLLQPLPGRWIFFGRVPEFRWQQQLWSMVSKAPMLAYFEGDEPSAWRFRFTPEEGLVFRENSEVSKGRIEAIKVSMDPPLLAPAGERLETAVLRRVWGEESALSPAWKRLRDTRGVHLGEVAHAERLEQRLSLIEETGMGQKLGLATLHRSEPPRVRELFQTLELKFSAPQSAQGLDPVQCSYRLIDYFDGDAFLESVKGGEPGETLRLKAQLLLGGRSSESEIHGEVTEVTQEERDRDGQRRHLLRLQVSGVYRERLESILEVFQERQRELSHFIRMGRGA